MRPIWTGTISFGLLNIPVSLMAGERRTDLQFRMLDSRDKSPVRYERVNADSGEEVPWKEIVKAFEYDKGNYVVLEDEDFKKAASEGKESVEISGFVDESEIDTRYFDKPYVLVPGKKAEKGYVLLRDTLADLGKVGIARVVVRTREYLCMVKPLENALLLILLRFPQELVGMDQYELPEGKPADYRVQKAELAMARELIESMSTPWKPSEHKDEYRERLTKIIEKRMKQSGRKTTVVETDDEPDDEASTNVVDFTALLKKSLASNRRTPAKGKTPAKKTGKRAPARKKAANKKTAKKTGTKQGKKKSA
ncbi:MAG TPA: Ku protein [Arenimonas sp.]|nr:Ku protein [Arenimonas sp.]